VGTDACGKKLPEDDHSMFAAVCNGGNCDDTTDRWTCCDERCHHITPGTAHSCFTANGTVPIISPDDLHGTDWGEPYEASEAVRGYNAVNPTACGRTDKRPAMPKTPYAREKLAKAAMAWNRTISFLWLGLSKDPETSKWMWDDLELLEPQPDAGRDPWGADEPKDAFDHQRSCISTATGAWMSCSFAIHLRIACETFT